VLLRRLEHDIVGVQGGEAYRDLRRRVMERQVDPYSAADTLLARMPPRCS
jgi:AmiR/NasT family two-component response regulator